MPTIVNSSLKLALLSTALFLLMAGCAGRGSVVLEDERGRVIIESDNGGYYETDDDEYYETEDEEYYPSDEQHYSIPPGHMPPPGKCRIWYPNRPPGHQPPPGDCGYLRYRVPQGAILVEG